MGVEFLGEMAPDFSVSALLLAAGEGRRMGTLKQLLPLGGRCILEVSMESLLGARLMEVILVLGFAAEEIRSRIGTGGVKVVINPHYAQGMATSVRAGVSAVDPRAEGILIALGDQPFIPPEVIDRLIRAFEGGEKGIIVPTYRGRRGHPVIFHRRYRGELMTLQGDEGGRGVIARHLDDLLLVEVDCPGILEDIDDLEGYREGLSRLNAP